MKDMLVRFPYVGPPFWGDLSWGRYNLPQTIKNITFKQKNASIQGTLLAEIRGAYY